MTQAPGSFCLLRQPGGRTGSLAGWRVLVDEGGGETMRRKGRGGAGEGKGKGRGLVRFGNDYAHGMFGNATTSPQYRGKSSTEARKGKGKKTGA